MEVSPLMRLPPEIWDVILSNLWDHRDNLRVAESNVYLGNLIFSSPTRSQWMFALVFPHIVMRLTRAEIFTCRLVCRSWRHAVDYFLQNNIFHRPVFEETFPKYSSQPKIHCRLRPFLQYLEKEHLLYHCFSQGSAKTQKLLRSNTTSFSNPIVGHSAAVLETRNFSSQEFLERFGRNIFFLKIAITQLTCHEAVSRIYNIASLTPNLKKLDIYAIQLTANLLADVAPTKTIPTSIETLDLDITCETSEIYGCLVNHLTSPSLTCLSMARIPPNLPSCRIPHVKDISIRVCTSEDVQVLAEFSKQVQVQRLLIWVDGKVPISKVFEVAASLKDSLVNYGIQVHWDFFKGTDKSLEKSSYQDSTCLQECKIKRFAWRGFPPASLNFLTGLASTLEYLHFYVNSWSCEPGEDEALNLIEKLKINPVKVYEANVWNMFPRLREVTVNSQDGTDAEEIVFRRDIYYKTII